MLAFVTQLWETLLPPNATNPLILLPEGLDAFDNLFSRKPTQLASSPTGFLRDLAAHLTDVQPDALLLIPPVVGYESLPQTLQKQHPEGTNLHDIALLEVLEKAPVGCQVVAWLPLGFFLTSGHTLLRQALLAEHRPRLVLEFPWEVDAFGLPAYLPARRMHTFVFEVGQGGDDLMRFFTCPHIPDLVDVDGNPVPDTARQQAVVDDLRSLLSSTGKPSEYGFVLQQPPKGAVPWLPGWQRQEFQKQLTDLEKIGQLRPLDELFEVLRGFAIREQVNVLVSANNSREGIPVIEESNLLEDNTLNYRDTRHRALHDETADYHLQPNDICVRQSLSRNQRLTVVQITSEMLPLAAHESVLILRSRPGVAVDHDLVAAYLRSSRVADFLRAQGIASRVYRDSLAEVLIPAEDDELRSALTGIRSAANAMLGWCNEANGATELLFAGKSAQEGRRAFLVTGRKLYQRERAARQIDELSYRLRTGLPHPLAYRWRQAETVTTDYEGYRTLLETAEVVVCFLANMALATARTIGVKIGYLQGMAANLSTGSHGTSFGEWVAILSEYTGSKAVEQAINNPLPELALLFDDENTKASLAALNAMRNDDAHGRGPRGPQVAVDHQTALGHMRSLMQSIEFLSEYPLRHVTNVQHDSLSGLTLYTYEEMMGDHPLVAQCMAETETVNLEQGSLYLIGRGGKMVLLRPFLTRQQMEDGRWGTFFLDKFDHPAQSCVLKCLEGPGVCTTGEHYNTFRLVGMRQ